MMTISIHQTCPASVPPSSGRPPAPFHLKFDFEARHAPSDLSGAVRPGIPLP